MAHHLTTSPPHRLGLALSGGGARGIAHLGLLAALDELGLPVARLTGCSSGAIVGAFYAAGFAPREVLRIILDTNLPALTRPALRRHSLFSLSAVEALLARHLGPDIRFEELLLPLTLVATDLAAGESVYYSAGPLLPPLLGTVTIPVICPPVAYEGRQLVDGGILNNLPVEPLLGRPDLVVVGSHTNPVAALASLPGVLGIFERTMHLCINANTTDWRRHCRLLLEPPALHRFRVFSYRQAEEIFDIGYRYALEHEAALREVVDN